MPARHRPRKPIMWLGDSLDVLRGFPRDVRDEVGFALFQAELGGHHPLVKPLTGYGGASVLEIVEDYDGNTYRCVYTVKFHEAVYVLHAFQKKSKSGRATPRHDLDRIRRRLVYAGKLHEEWKHAQDEQKP